MSESLLEGEYVPSTNPATRDQVELYERTGGREGATMLGGPLGDRRLMTARVTEGAERESWMEYADQLYPFFAEHREHAADNSREIPLVLLEPAGD